jgi:hypothetical protein
MGKIKDYSFPFLSVVPSRDEAEKAIRDLAVEIGSIFIGSIGGLDGVLKLKLESEE